MPRSLFFGLLFGAIFAWASFVIGQFLQGILNHEVRYFSIFSILCVGHCYWAILDIMKDSRE